jgi:hypothetical protein
MAQRASRWRHLAGASQARAGDQMQFRQCNADIEAGQLRPLAAFPADELSRHVSDKLLDTMIHTMNDTHHDRDLLWTGHCSYSLRA